jgi:hypothetical protein
MVIHGTPQRELCAALVTESEMADREGGASHVHAIAGGAMACMRGCHISFA